MANEYPFSNVEYDLLSTLHTKLEGLEAYKKYIEDCRREGDKECEQFFNQMMQQDQEHARRLHQLLGQFMGGSGTHKHQTGSQGMQSGAQGRA